MVVVMLYSSGVEELIVGFVVMVKPACKLRQPWALQLGCKA
jgi:hypothetical protein